ncbi:MAG: acetyl-CoA carboxylase biotin carboxylase subunit [Myxococcota bacterium]
MGFKRVLIANRGEIAVRVARTLRDMGMEPVAVYSDADRLAPHVRLAEFAYHVGKAPAPESYLVVDRILDVAVKAGVDAIHPGYGFLSENAEFAEAAAKRGITFIGPPPNATRLMGSKTAAREAMIKAGVPTVPGSKGAIDTEEEAVKVADEIGFPVMVKAAAGGGGKGMRLVSDPKDLPSAYRGARSEALSGFGDDTVYIEKAIVRPKHIEIQVLSGPDSKTVWLGERECSMQRRHQKVIEETPSPLLSDEVRRQMGEVACKAAEAVGYIGAGTVEFIADEKAENFYFLEMNTRLQVEHPVTEMCTGLDLVEEQIRVAQGELLRFSQDDLERKGHSIEVRIYAEDPDRNFMPAPGKITDIVLPTGPGVRVDTGVGPGFEVPRFYDPMIAKVVTWGRDREQARMRMIRALDETAVKGIITNTTFLRHLLRAEEFIDGSYHTGSIGELMESGQMSFSPDLIDVAVAAATVNTYRRDTRAARAMAIGEGRSGASWRNATWRFGGGG